MASERITIRLDFDLKADLQKEAAKRKQDVGVLARTFVRDGLSGYDALNEKILQNGEQLEDRVKRLETMVGAVLHVIIEQQVLSSPRTSEESQEDYVSRLKSMYTDKVHAAIDKGALIKSVVKIPKT